MDELMVALTKDELIKAGTIDSLVDLISDRPGLAELREQRDNLGVDSCFDDCPYNCKKGRLFNFDTRKYVECPNCSEKKRMLISDNAVITTLSDGTDIKLEVRLCDLLGIDQTYFNIYKNFEFDDVVRDQGLLVDSVTAKVKEKMEEVYSGLVLSEAPERSYCFGIGSNGSIEAFVYPFLRHAYTARLTVSRFVLAEEFINPKINLDQFTYSDVCIIMIPMGGPLSALSAAEYVMQRRAKSYKSTIFVTRANEDYCSNLLGFPYSPGSKYEATPVFVKYKKSE